MISPTSSGVYPVPESVGHPEGPPNDPGHRRFNHPVNQTDDSQRRKRTEVLQSERRNDAGEHGA